MSNKYYKNENKNSEEVKDKIHSNENVELDNEIEEVVELVNEVEENVEKEPKPLFGTVVNCSKLNVRKDPDVKSKSICVLNIADAVDIYLDESTDDFYRITTAYGIEGFCMKKYINILS